jgi:ABC-type amino acid transport substrate-binding protein
MNMKTTLLKKTMKSALAMTCILALGVAMTGCSTQASVPAAPAATEAVTAPATEGQLALIKEKGKIVLGTSADYPPYEFHKTIDGKDTIVGFDIEIAKAVAKDLGVELEIVDMKFEGLLPALMGGKIDFIVAGMNPTEERKKSVAFSVEYYEAHQTILVATDQKAVLNSLESFKGKAIGVQKGTLQEQIATEQFKDSQVKAIGKIPDLIMELKTGKISGILLADTVAKSYVTNNADLSTNGMDLGSEGGVSIAMSKENPELTAEVNKTLEALMSAGKIDQWITDANLMVEN